MTEGMHTVVVTVLTDHGATVAKAACAGLTATGSAKREPGDEHDPETGQLLAVSRALEHLAGRLRRRADGRIRAAESVKRHHREISQRERRPAEAVAAADPVTGEHVTREQEQEAADRLEQELVGRLVRQLTTKKEKRPR